MFIQVAYINAQGTIIDRFTPNHKGYACNLAIDLSMRPKETVRVIIMVDRKQIVDLAL